MTIGDSDQVHSQRSHVDSSASASQDRDAPSEQDQQHHGKPLCPSESFTRVRTSAELPLFDIGVHKSITKTKRERVKKQSKLANKQRQVAAKSLRELAKRNLADTVKLTPEQILLELEKIPGANLSALNDDERKELGEGMAQMLKAQAPMLAAMLETTSPIKQGWATFKGAWWPPRAIATLFKRKDWKGASNHGLGARFGAMGDLMASSTGVAAVLAGQPHELVRLLITVAGVTGSFSMDQVDKARGLLEKAFPELLAQQGAFSNFGSSMRPGVDPVRAGAAYYVPAGLSFFTSGAKRAANSGNWYVGLGDMVGASFLLAGFSSVMFLNDPRTGELLINPRTRKPYNLSPEDFHIDPQSGMLVDKNNQPAEIGARYVVDIVVRKDGQESRMAVLKYLSIPEAKRPKVVKYQLRKPVLVDKLTGLKNKLAGSYRYAAARAHYAGRTLSADEVAQAKAEHRALKFREVDPTKKASTKPKKTLQFRKATAQVCKSYVLKKTFLEKVFGSARLGEFQRMRMMGWSFLVSTGMNWVQTVDRSLSFVQGEAGVGEPILQLSTAIMFTLCNIFFMRGDAAQSDPAK